MAASQYLRLPAAAALLLLLQAPAAVAQTFHGQPCTDDCSGHQAGYDWAAAKGIRTASSCGGNSASFINGCLVYVMEHTPAVLYGCHVGSDECREACDAADNLSSAASDLARCAGASDLSDDCSRQFRDTSDAFSDYESAVSDTDGECE